MVGTRFVPGLVPWFVVRAGPLVAVIFQVMHQMRQFTVCRDFAVAKPVAPGAIPIEIVTGGVNLRAAGSVASRPAAKPAIARTAGESGIAGHSRRPSGPWRSYASDGRGSTRRRRGR